MFAVESEGNLGKKILIADHSDALRRAAEQALRGAGFEVISVGSVDRAREALQFARPDLLMIGSDLRTADDKPFYDRLQSEKKTASLPLMVIQAGGDTALPLPSEIIVTQPIDTADLIQRVTVFAGLAQSSSPTSVGSLHIDDNALDTALGLDGLDVVNSEVMNQTSHGRVAATGKQVDDKLIGFDVSTMNDTTITRKGKSGDSTRVETKMVREENRPAPPPTKSGTGSLEIVRDQSAYFQHLEERPADVPMDFSSFMDELREEIKTGAPGKAAPPPPSRAKDELKFTSPAAGMENVRAAAPAPVTPGGSRATAGVEKFIDQFKKEIEQLRSDDPLDTMLDPKASRSGGLRWEESMETVSADHVRLFSRQLAHDIAEKIAEKIVSKIDADRLLALITQEVLARQKKPPES